MAIDGNGWSDEPPKESGYYWARYHQSGDLLDGNACEVVYLYYDGKWSVFRPGHVNRFKPDEFKWWPESIVWPGEPPEGVSV